MMRRMFAWFLFASLMYVGYVWSSSYSSPWGSGVSLVPITAVLPPPGPACGEECLE